MSIPNQDKLVEQWKKEESQPFSGWDFSYLDGRMVEADLPWSYMQQAGHLLRQAHSALDMDTGGGERLLDLRPHWPAKMVATEEYPPNLALATARLTPLGVPVLDIRLTLQDSMPFAAGEFDLVLNRHAPFNPAEVARILTPGGHFLTQQVHGLWAEDLLAAFDAKPQWPFATPEFYTPQLEAAGLHIRTNQSWSGALTFTEVGAIVYYLKAVPWLVPGFSVDGYLPHLLALQTQLESGEGLRFTARTYLLAAVKPPIP